MAPNQPETPRPVLSRRDFLRLAALAAGAALTACQAGRGSPTPSATPNFTSTPRPTRAPTATRTLAPTLTPTATPTLPPAAPTLRSLGERAGHLMGIGLDTAQDTQSAVYQKTVAEHFSMIEPERAFRQTWLDGQGEAAAKEFTRMAGAARQTLVIAPAFWHGDVPARLSGAPAVQVTDYMKGRLETLMGFARQAADLGSPVQLDVVREAFAYDRGNITRNPSPFLRTLGPDWAGKAFEMAAAAAEKAGLKPGKELQLYISEFDIARSGPKLDYFLELLAGLQKNAGGAPVGIGMLMPLDVNTSRVSGRTYVQSLTVEALAEVMRRLGALGRLRVDVSYYGASEQSLRIQAAQRILNALLRSGAAGDVVLLEGLRLDDAWHGPRFLFDAGYGTDVGYDALAFTLKDWLNTTPTP